MAQKPLISLGRVDRERGRGRGKSWGSHGMGAAGGGGYQGRMGRVLCQGLWGIKGRAGWGMKGGQLPSTVAQTQPHTACAALV